MVIYGKLVLTAIFWGGTFVAARVVAQNVGPFSASFLIDLTSSPKKDRPPDGETGLFSQILSLNSDLP